VTDVGNGSEAAGDENRPTWPAVGVILAVLWLFVRGVPLTPSAIVGELLVGLVFGLPVAYASRRFYWPEADPTRFLRVAPYTLLYATSFAKELLVANVDVAYRVLAPSMPIEPRVIVLPLRVRTDMGITTIANSITLTPGTLTMDYDEDRNALYVHAIDGRDPEALVRPIRRWEDLALVIFGEELGPDDPVPAHESMPAGAASVDEPMVGGDPDGE